ncbi:CCA tRNA nucleotidyltransferase [Roseovarius amoyensis]|uniref:CCA tRNA nucleotidyltransferase n=1 Tax=Roseovarius amoyensis TaxID=2211448 RepID=UPI000DBE54D6|nr:CCA tRNA nucleotidyltransferase [Roseovarius amoyensis]
MKVSGKWLDRTATQAVCRMLTEAGHQALFVGGCVRNALLGVEVADIDIATDALPETVVELAEKAGLKPVPTGIDHGTITVVSGGLPHEVTTFRKDVETFGRHATVAYSLDVTEDARRRDFTMNALYARPDGRVIDPLGGLDDLRARRVRFIENPHDRIREDYLRILRFFRFHAWYGQGGLDPDGLAACAELADGVENLSRERLGAEMLKLLSAPDPAPAVAAMRASGVLGRVLPGADDRLLAPLVHLEDSIGAAPDPIRRLAALGGEGAAERLRLSKAQARRLTRLGDGMASAAPAAELGYRDGAEAGRDIVLLRAALAGQPVVQAALDDLALGAGARFPVMAADLMPEWQGPALGRRLDELERQWIASRFALGRDELLQ